MLITPVGQTPDHVPPVSDPSWQQLTASLLGYCQQQPHTILEIVDWGRSQSYSGSLIRHMLAWLSFNGKVHYEIAAKHWRVGPEPARVENPVEDNASLTEIEFGDGL